MSVREEAALALAAAPGTLAGLYVAFKARLAAVAARFPLLETKHPDVKRAPAVIDGWLPPKTSADDLDVERFPFLIVRPKVGSDSVQGADENAVTAIEVVIGTFSDTDDGWLDVLLLIDAIRADLGAQPSIAGTGYEQTGPLTWLIPEQQPRPQWFGSVTSNWTLPRPQRAEARNPEG